MSFAFNDSLLQHLQVLAHSGGTEMALRLNRRALGRAMTKANLTQVGLARRAGVHYNTIYKMVNGLETQPALRTVNAVAKALNVNAFTLLIDDGEDVEGTVE